jgi:hypothetical protein
LHVNNESSGDRESVVVEIYLGESEETLFWKYIGLLLGLIALIATFRILLQAYAIRKMEC